MKSLTARVFIVLALVAAAVLSFADGLTVGSPAPAIKVSKWVKGNPVTEFKKGNIYVVEFWATWCGPCKESIPHLTEMAKKFKDQVTFVGVSAFETDQALVAPFVEKMGDKMDYNVAMDDQDSPTARTGFMAKNWMDAANQNGIPTAFVVGKDGDIAWIGHPMEMEPVLEKVVAGTWDEKAYADKVAADNAARDKMMAVWKNHPVRKELITIAGLRKDKKYADVLTELDKLEKMDGKDSQVDPQKYAVMVRPDIYALMGDMDGFYAADKKAFDVFKDDAPTLNSIAWKIADPKSTLQKKDYGFAIKVAERAVKLTERKEGAMLDTLAWAHFGKGEKDKAIALEKEAIKLIPDADRADYDAALKTFQGA